jgi:hypothetical protein
MGHPALPTSLHFLLSSAVAASNRRTVPHSGFAGVQDDNCFGMDVKGHLVLATPQAKKEFEEKACVKYSVIVNYTST